MELNELLTLSVNRGASDLHLSAGMPPMLRIYGDLKPIETFMPLNCQAISNMVDATLDSRQKNQFKTNLELDYVVTLPSIARFRVNVFHQYRGIAAVFRVIPDQTPTLDELGLPTELKARLAQSNGLILVTGPSGSGKSTSLAAMVNYINESQSGHIITIEDPIEFTHKSKKCLINQRQVYRDTKGFAEALRSSLREDPDVILVGELRDLDTIRLALTAAETGHLVMATLHTSSAPRSIHRIVDVFPNGEKNRIRNTLSESLQAVIYQILVKQVGTGQMAAMEVMLGTPAIRHLIREDKIAQMYSAIQTGSEAGMCTLDQSLQRLLGKQVITRSVAYEAAVCKELFE